MAVAPASKAVLAVACVAMLSALVIATRLPGPSQRELLAPDAWKALNRNEPARASALFIDELKRHPDDAGLHFGAGSAAYAAGRQDTALESLRKAVELDSRFVEAWTMLADIAYERGKSELAMASLEKAAALRPRDRRIAETLEHWRRESSTHGSYLERPTGHFRILYEGVRQQAIGDRVARVLEREYQRISRTLQTFPGEPISVMLYTNREFQDLTRAPSWAAGSYDGRIRVAVGGNTSEGEIDRVITHELVHAVIASAGRIPAWLNEGLATYLESSDPAWATAALRRSAAIMPLADLVRGFSGFDEQQAVVAYAESAVAAEVLIAQLGSNLGPFLEMVGHGSSIDQALLEFHVQPNAFEAEWARRTGVR